MYQHIYINESKANTISQVHHELPINPFKKHCVLLIKLLTMELAVHNFCHW